MDEREHEIHMQKVKDGLNQILKSNDLEEIKAIAQELLGEEESEMKEESSSETMSVPKKVDGGEMMKKFYMGE